MKKCSVKGCENKSRSRGLCPKHYTRWLKSGNPLVTSREVNTNPPEHCTFGDCKKKHYAKGLCSAHYNRLIRHGDPSIKLRTSQGEAARWLDEHRIYSGDECLEWPFVKDRKGYGLATLDGVQRTASNVMCRLANGEPPSEKHECAHTCGKGHKGCVNPNHLRWATRKENHHDKIHHGTTNRGSRNSTSKLKESEVKEIRKLKGINTCFELAEIYSVTTSTISAIWTRKRWAWLK